MNARSGSSASWTIRLASLLLGAALGSAAASAQVCDVPATLHPTLAAALRDPACSSLAVAPGIYSENLTIERDVAIAGAGSATTIVAGAVFVSGATTDATLAALALDGTAAGVAGCWSDLLRATGGAQLVAGPDVVVTNSAASGTACRIFADGFESGGTLAWSATVP